MPACLNRVGIAVPSWEMHDTFVRFADSLLQSRRDRALLSRMVARGGIDQRWSVLESDAPTGFYAPGAFPSTGARMRVYEHHAPALAERAVMDLGLGESIREVSHLIVVSCTGFVAPGIDLALVQRLGLRHDVERTVVGFMGCHAGLTALKLARHVVRSEPDAKVLVVSVELCTLHFQDTAELEKILSFSLFGDGAAAALISSDPSGLELDSFETLLVTEEPDLITWKIRDQGFDMVLSGKVPGALLRALREDQARLVPDRAEIDAWLVHPGGRSILDAVDEAFALPHGALDASRSVLSRFGNMSSATVLFVARELLRSSAPCSRGLALAFGPGLTAETMRFHRLPS